MQYIMIAPLAFLRAIRKLDKAPAYPWHMMLAHLCENEEYRNFFQEERRLGAHLVLDNGEYEGQQVPMADYVRLFHAIQPDIVVAPDAMGDISTTVLRTRKFIDMLGSASHVEGVIQGKGLWEYLKCHEDLVRMGCTYIGFPRRMKKKRLELIRQMQYLGLMGNVTYTALGWTNLNEVRQLAAREIQMLDTSAPVWRGLNGWGFCNRATMQSWTDPPFKWDAQGVGSRFELALANLRLMEEACKST